jgi:hypothetical protein
MITKLLFYDRNELTSWLIDIEKFRCEKGVRIYQDLTEPKGYGQAFQGLGTKNFAFQRPQVKQVAIKALEGLNFSATNVGILQEWVCWLWSPSHLLISHVKFYWVYVLTADVPETYTKKQFLSQNANLSMHVCKATIQDYKNKSKILIFPDFWEFFSEKW